MGIGIDHSLTTLKAATKIRAYFLSMMQPIRTSISTNINVLQTSVFLKYHPLYVFLQRYARPVAQEIQRAYIGCAKLYYETGFRRYTRNLGYIKVRFPRRYQVHSIDAFTLLKARSVDKQVLLGDVANEQGVPAPYVDAERIPFAKLDGPNTTLAYQADDKSYVRNNLFQAIR